MNKPVDLFFDIETSPMLVFAWALGKQDIDYKRIYKERQVLMIGYAIGDGPVEIMTQDYDKYDLHQRDNDADLGLLEQFSVLLAGADRAIGHNAKRFDIAVMRSRLIKHRLPDFNPVLIDDTYAQTKGIGFASHKLDYMTGFLGLEQKKDHPFEMWLRVVMHEPGAFEEMQTYCKGDVEINRAMYHRLEPYTKSTLNMAVWSGKPKACRHCGSTKLIRRKYKYTPSGRYAQFQCGQCGKYSTFGKNDLKQGGTFLR